MALWGDKIVSLGREIGIYDLQLNQLTKIELPPKKEGFGNNCGNGPLQVSGNNVFVVTDCGDVSAYDLESLKLKYTIPALANFASIALIEDLLFVSPVDKNDEKIVHVYSADSGKELSIEPIKGKYLFANNDRLLSVEFNFSKTSPMWLYEISQEEITSGARILSRVVSECTKAKNAAAQGDIYRAISLCESGGILAAIKNGEDSAVLQPFIKDYGIWLSQTLSRYSESIQILEKIAVNGDKSVEEHIAEANLKSRFFSNQIGVHPATERERMTRFGQLSLMPKPSGREVSVDFGAFDNLFHFSGEQVYVGAWGCSSGDGVSLRIYDRSTFELIKSVLIEGCDDDYQDTIESIATDDSKIYLSIGYRYESKDRTDFISINRKTLVTEAEKHLSAGTLFFNEGKLFSCDCGGSNSGCTSIDPISFTKHDEAMECRNNGYSDEARLRLPQSGEMLGATKASAQGDIKNIPLSSDYPKVGVVSGDRGVSVQITITPSQSSPARVIADLKTLPNAGVATLANDNLLFIGNGHDLLIYDLNGFQLRRYIKDFIPNSFANNGFGVDTNRISRLLVDRGRLLALTFNGQNSQLIDLKGIY